MDSDMQLDLFFDKDKFATELTKEKLSDAEIMPDVVEFNHEEAELAGAFIEDALTEHDVQKSIFEYFAEEDAVSK